ncbi:MAG: hypothetical protein ACXAD7_01985 [Candidatus Kariarchaeaceae archaeon]
MDKKVAEYIWKYIRNPYIPYKQLIFYYALFYITAITTSYIGWVKSDSMLIVLGPIIALSGKVFVVLLISAPKAISILKRLVKKPVNTNLD